MFRINKVIRAYIYWDIVVNAAWGLLSPVFAIFLLQSIAVGNVAEGARVAGFATLCYWLTKAVFQIPIGNYLDRNHGEIDDFWFYVVGIVITGIVPFGFLTASVPWHIYVLQCIHAFGMSMVVPSANAIFIRHIDKGREAFESSFDSTVAGVGVGITGALGGIIAGTFGFRLIFVLTGIFTLISALFIYSVKDQMQRKVPHHLHTIPKKTRHEKPGTR